MNQVFEEIFKSVFDGVANSTAWQAGFDDAIAGKKPQSGEHHYTLGYGVGYEYCEKEDKQSGNANQRVI